MSGTCDFLYTKGGLRIPSGHAVVTIRIDDVERDLKVMRNGKGRSNLEKGFISLKDLAEHVPEGSTVKVKVEHSGVVVPLELDPRHAMGREGRDGHDGLEEAVSHLDIAQRYALGMLQIETLPYGSKNLDSARSRLKYALTMTHDEILDHDELELVAHVLDEDTTEMFLRRHPAAASRLVYGLSRHGLNPDLMAATSPAALRVMKDLGLLDENRGIPLLERADLTEEELSEIVAKNATLDPARGVHVGPVPLEVWRRARRGRLDAVGSVVDASNTLASTAPFQSAEGEELELTGRRYSIDQEQVVFGAPSASSWSDDTIVLPRNPFKIAGLAVDSSEGRDLAVAYTAAIAAVCESSRAPGCWRCQSRETRCAACAVDPEQDLRAAARALLGDIPSSYGYGTDTTVVDALLYARSRGDETAREAFDTLAQLGETMVINAKSQRMQVIDAEMFPAAASGSTWHASHETSERLRSVWINKTAAEMDELVRTGRLDAGQAAAFKDELFGTQSSDLRDKVRDRVNSDVQMVVNQRAEQLHGYSMEDLFWVREIDHLPEIDADGNAVMRPAGDFVEVKRGSLHGSLNGRAMGHMFRSGDEASHVVIARVSDIIAANPGAVDVLYAIDTYFTPPPGEGLKLPAGMFQLHSYEGVTPTQEHRDAVTLANATEETRESLARDNARDAFVQELLTGIGAARRFPQSTHYSSSGVDSLVRRLAASVGAGSGLHANTFSSRAERLDRLDSISASGGQNLYLDASDLASMGPNARMRLVAHDDWAGVTASRKRDDFANSIV